MQVTLTYEHEVMTVDKEDSLEFHRSQGARLNCLGTPSIMSSDPLTKVMESTKLVECLTTNKLNIEPPTDSVIKKRAKQLQRRKTAAPAEPFEGMDENHS